MHETVRVNHWEQTFPPGSVPNAVFEAIAERQAWSYEYVQSLSPGGDDSPRKLVIIAFGEYGCAAPEDMLLVQPIKRREAGRILVQACGYGPEYIDYILLSTTLYRLSHDGLALWWIHSLDQQNSQLMLDLTGDTDS